MPSAVAKPPPPPVSLAFWISIIANILLIGVIGAWLLRRDLPAAGIPTHSVSATAPAALPKQETVKTEAELSSQGHGDIRSAVAELESMGYSRAVLAQGLIEDFAKRWDQRFVELQRKHGFRPIPEREAIELSRQRDAEQIRELKEALGEEGYLAWDQERTLGFMNTGGVTLNPTETEMVYRLQKEFDRKHRELQMAMEDGVADPADGATLQQQAYQELNAQLAELLGRERAEKMRGVGEPIDEIAWKFADLSPTPEQAQQLLQAEAAQREREAALLERVRENPADAANLAAELKAMNDAREENMRRIFGTEAYENYERESDPTFRKLQQFATAWELKDEEIQSIYESLHAFHTQAERTRTAAELRAAAGQPVNWREIDAAIRQAQQQTELGLQNLIGAERLRRIKQNGVLTTVRPPR